MNKNVKGFIGLFAGIAAFILIGIALFVPTNPLHGSSISLHGSVNVYLALGAAVLGVVAIVFGALSSKDKDKYGPRKAGVIVGVFAVIIALIASAVCSLTREIINYANGEENTIVSKMSEKDRKELDQNIEKLIKEYPADNA